MTQPANPVSVDIQSPYATIRMGNAPVNALSQAVRVGLLDALNTALNDPSVEVILITSSLELFSAGADISEFKAGNLAPPLPDVLDAIEQSNKPVVALLNGPAFGGGLELALACHYRVSIAGNKVGLPEVHLGILPGAGGTQRLPRLVGIEKALQTIVSGQPQSVDKLAGVVDSIIGDVSELPAALDNLLSAWKSTGHLRRTCDLAVPEPQNGAAAIEAFRAKAQKEQAGFFAPHRCIDAVEQVLSGSFADGLKQEARLFMACMQTPQARAQQHFFFAERAAGHVKDFDKQTPIRAVQKVAVIGAGTMGGGIAMNFANAGIPVTLLDLNEEGLHKGLAIVRRNYENSAKKGKLSAEDVEQRMQCITPATSYDALADVDLVIEAVFEKMSVKRDVFGQLDKVCKASAILATNTSTLDINEIASATSRPESVIGLHFFSPANVMKLLEVVKAEHTAADVIKTCMQLAKRIRKVPVLVGVCFGFVGNRMIEPYGREANRLLLEGVAPERIDKVLTDFGMPMGPFTMGDMAGLDIGYFVRQSRQAFIAHDPSYAVVADRLVEQGRVGLKAGKGVYLYEAGSRVPVPDPEVMVIAREEAARLGVTQRDDVTDEEILVRCLYTLINEGADILQEGIAAKSSDIDVIYVYGYGFPVYRGGPMQYADEIGVSTLYEKLCHYRDKLGAYGNTWLQPSSLVSELAASSGRFSEWKGSK